MYLDEDDNNVAMCKHSLCCETLENLQNYTKWKINILQMNNILNWITGKHTILNTYF